ncbi:30S ribosomal protein S8e [Candidatus Woesearchaeota archaeon]|nr:30S ribosomal protein S8e [Candidatus Woesearchaeota archaeon]
MVIIHYRSKRKASGGRYKAHRKKRLFEAGNSPTFPTLGERKIKAVRTKGGNIKTKLVHDEFMNVTDLSTKKSFKVKITNVTDNPANKQYTRQNILTKGAIVQTEKGKARITNRPAQDGCVSGVLIS